MNEDKVQFSKIKTQEEFFGVFQGLCNIAESAFNEWDKEFPNPTEMDRAQYAKGVSYLMSVTFVIMGMRGNWRYFRDDEMFPVFFVEIDGMQYDQKYLYKMNDYFADRFNKVLAILEKIDPESHKVYQTVWRNY